MQGAQLVFERFIVPFLKHYASHIDPVFKTTDQASLPYCLPLLMNAHLFCSRDKPALSCRVLTHFDDPGNYFVGAEQPADGKRSQAVTAVRTRNCGPGHASGELLCCVFQNSSSLQERRCSGLVPQELCPNTASCANIACLVLRTAVGKLQSCVLLHGDTLQSVIACVAMLCPASMDY